jgi:hypothetical protein
MSPNLNYRAGRRVEYGRRKHWIKRGFEVVRSAGSHGIWDLCGVRLEDPNHPVQFIQCKRVDTVTQARALVRKFQQKPPMKPSPHYNMVLEVQVKGSSEIISITL